MSPVPSEEKSAIVRRHLRAGWWGLVVYLALGITLEGLHAFKVGAYLDVGNETRRLLFRLAHAHGTLLSLVQLAFAFTVTQRPEAGTRTASAALLVALVLLPAGFFLGGLSPYAGDPGLGIVFAPLGALALLVGGVAVARRA